MILTVLFYFFVAFTAIQIIYYLVFSSFLFKPKKEKITDSNVPFSVIVCAKNEAKNLQDFLPSIINQDYPNFEIVLINDASSDDTLEIMQSFEKQHSNIKVINVENIEAFWGNKKYPLTLGIKGAKNEHLLFTDADCKPVSKHWISEMAKNFNKEKTIVLGYGKYKREKSLINLFVRYETLLTAIQYFSYAKLGSPYMGVGRNLAYHRSEFFSVKGFINHIHIRSGDDDLFIQDAANKENTTISISEKSFTESIAPKNFTEWFRQKRRHISTAKHYKNQHKFFLGLFFVSKVLFYLLAITLFFFYPWQLILAIFLTYYLVQFIVIGMSSKKLKEPTITYLLPFLEIGLLIFQFSIFITNLSSKPNHWK
ncbi:glycosyltransferase [Polaribacter sp. Z014]|uniref:glycosyltransferase n=1 Tax=unclassified Polaribacter TaxID=196858 RepID=UPI00193BA74D|nr:MULTISPECIES: glycosyltransferase [unclassified Polaribacter]MCL7764655.1 glycosyltransferase [Polaribacter sp. Z014]QVY65851.1 glycosyltransferase [Polaribacter sp. Q13]